MPGIAHDANYLVTRHATPYSIWILFPPVFPEITGLFPKIKGSRFWFQWMWLTLRGSGGKSGHSPNSFWFRKMKYPGIGCSASVLHYIFRRNSNKSLSESVMENGENWENGIIIFTYILYTWYAFNHYNVLHSPSACSCILANTKGHSLPPSSSRSVKSIHKSLPHHEHTNQQPINYTSSPGWRLM